MADISRFSEITTSWTTASAAGRLTVVLGLSEPSCVKRSPSLLLAGFVEIPSGDHWALRHCALV